MPGDFHFVPLNLRIDDGHDLPLPHLKYGSLLVTIPVEIIRPDDAFLSMTYALFSDGS